MATTVNTPAQAVAEARRRATEELKQRKGATTILTPEDVRGEYDAGRLLMTTLGGTPRVLTDDDLRQFAHQAKQLGKRFTGGITARQVIDMSLPDRRSRSNEQIRFAVPMEFKGGRLHLVTNAGPDSKSLRHHVHVEFLNYTAAVASPSKMADIAKTLTTGPLRFDCDCGDHRFRFRYIATAGKYNAGRAEPGFPKLTNPTLKGVACKHVIRVMHSLSQPILRKKVEEMVLAGRGDLTAKTRRVTKKEAEQIAVDQQQRATWQRSQVETTEERKSRLAQAKAMKTVADRGAAAPKPAGEQQKKAARSEFSAQLAKMVKLGLVTQGAADKMLKEVK